MVILPLTPYKRLYLKRRISIFELILRFLPADTNEDTLLHCALCCVEIQLGDNLVLLQNFKSLGSPRTTRGARKNWITRRKGELF